MIAYLKLIRPLNLLIIITTMYLFRYCFVVTSTYRILYITHELSNIQFLLLVLSTIFIAAGGYVINDIYDVEIDKINRPEKVWIDIIISEMAAYNYYKVLCFLSGLTTLLLAISTKNYRLCTVPIILMVLLNFYAFSLKRQLIVGNFIIAFCTSFSLILIALFENNTTNVISPQQTYIRSGITLAALVYALFAFLTTFLREVIKDAEDIKGDKLENCKSIPIVFGTKGVKITASIIVLILSLLFISFMVFFYSLTIKINLLFIAFGLLIPLFIIYFFTLKAKNTKNYHFISNLIKFFMCVGIASMLYFGSGIGPYIFVEYASFLQKLF